ncbi:hypothetical protein P4641_21505 [Halalkalibacterium halodurans]|uniref:hypothetical protein n=1 Tax=Halalkalibacterium halodurans TaxID=86665 RepID=UPI002E1AFD0D|nr:hypothetical protein [Halalkalibacterium halodurans]
MMTKPLKDLNRAELEVILSAMRLQVRSLKEPERDLFTLDFKKVLEKGKNVELDGMGMKHIAYALRRKALMLTTLYGNEAHKAQKKLLYNLAYDITMKRIRFQQEHNPLNKQKETPASPKADVS